MDASRRSASFSKIDRKTGEWIGEKMSAQDAILDKVNRKHLIWYGHVERRDPSGLPKIVINWERGGRRKRSRPERWDTAMGERDLRMADWNSRRKWNVEVGRRRQTFENWAIYIYIYIFIYLFIYTGSAKKCIHTLTKENSTLYNRLL